MATLTVRAGWTKKGKYMFSDDNRFTILRSAPQRKANTVLFANGLSGTTLKQYFAVFINERGVYQLGNYRTLQEAYAAVDQYIAEEDAAWRAAVRETARYPERPATEIIASAKATGKAGGIRVLPPAKKFIQTKGVRTITFAPNLENDTVEVSWFRMNMCVLSSVVTTQEAREMWESNLKLGYERW